MTERPILFSAPMVRALLDGSKTQTRRIANTGLYAIDARFHGEETAARELEALSKKCPYGSPSDRLWVRETFADTGTGYTWRATYCQGRNEAMRWKPSIHMPRAASRILLEVVSVRVERLQDVSEADAAAEGWSRRPEVSDDPQVHADAARDWYMDLWEQINGAGSWDANPWVWVIEFKRVTP